MSVTGKKICTCVLIAILIFPHCVRPDGNSGDNTIASKPGKIFFILTIDLPGKLPGSYCRGDYMVRCGEEVLATGNIEMNDLSSYELRTFKHEIDLSGFQLSADDLIWRFRGEVYDEKLDKTFGPMVMQREKWDDGLLGIGYHISINENGTIHTEKKVFFQSGSPAVEKDILPENPFPTTDGPYPVGVRSYFWIDQDREEIFTTNPTDRRHLLVEVWYPAEKIHGAEIAPYIQNPEYYGPSADSSVIVHLKTNSLLNAPLSDANVKYPVVLFSHGMNANRFSSTFLMEYLASNGYIVFSIGHTFFNGIEVFPDGYHPVRDFFPEMEESSSQEEGYQKYSEFIQKFTITPMAEDVQFVLDQIEQLQDKGDTLFSQRIDLERLGICGWSIGGVNAAYLCSFDDRFKAGINFDGTLNSIIAEKGVQQPFMILKGEPPEPANPDEEYITMVEMIRKYETDFISHSEQVIALTITGARHTNFSDAPLYNEAAKGNIDTELCYVIINRLTLSFFNQYIMEEKDEDIFKVASSYPEILMETDHR